MKRALAAGLLLCAGTALAWMLCPKPSLEGQAVYSRAYLDADGQLLRLTLARDQRYRLYRRLDEIAPQFVEATLLYEDRDYYDHVGVDIAALLRAFRDTYITRERRIGASTITMQVARLHWNIASNTLAGKLEQILRALQLSRHYGKDELLEIYLNIAPYGRNIEGIGAASLVYFNKTPDRLSLPEALALAVVPQNPGKRNPTSVAGYAELSRARDRLFARWLERYPGDEDQARFFELPLQVRAPEQLPFTAPHFVDYLERRVPRYRHGVIATTLHAQHQQHLQRLLGEYVAARADYGIRNAAALLLDYRNMRVEAMVGSADFFDAAIHGQVNGTLAKRSPGSTLKPFVYALAMDEGLVHPLSLLRDSPRRFGGFTPDNFDRRFVGPVSVKQALIDSRNVPAVDLQARLTRRSVYRFLQEAGVSDLQSEDFYGLALALGGGELTMLELATLYAMLANDGVHRPARMLLDDETGPGRSLLSAEAAFLTLDILRDNPPPHDRPRLDNGRSAAEVAWKTGTSWSFRDAWAIGVSGPYVLAVWIGNFDGQGNPAFTGRAAAGPLLFSLLDSLPRDPGWRVGERLARAPLNLKKLRVCATTGDLYEADCPAAVDTWFIPGVSPIRLSNVYRRIPVEIASGRRACRHRPGHTELRVFEFWPSELLEVFARAGIRLETPPAWADDCSLDQRHGSGQGPEIRSPQAGIAYLVSGLQGTRVAVPLEASVDPDVEQLYWFIDDRFVGSAERGTPLIWHARPGNFEARVVDDAGRAASQRFVVGQVNRNPGT